MTAVGLHALPLFEDRLLYSVAELTGFRPITSGTGAATLDSVEAAMVGDHDAPRNRTDLIRLVQRMVADGLLETRGNFSDWRIWPTVDGRRRAMEWRDRLDRDTQHYILEELDRQRRANPDYHKYEGQVDVGRLCDELGISREAYLYSATRLRDQGKIAINPLDQMVLSDGWAHITEAGIGALEEMRSSDQGSHTDREGEIERLRARLAVAERTLRSLITDDELRARCEDLLAAGGHYDRVVREACVILENRVRRLSGIPGIGTALMEQAFSQRNPHIRLSREEQEQRGAMELFRGTMAFYRNSAGHNVIDSYTQEDALKLVAFVDLLLGTITRATNTTP